MLYMNVKKNWGNLRTLENFEKPVINHLIDANNYQTLCEIHHRLGEGEGTKRNLFWES